ncbi:type VII secretion-associated serine protease mycosin [Nocardia sp. NPDC058666]|uniref:type VII secretion-associated serine protease mycosin n=1 Tax=unclassified Nocardia TaxID=2637762 RepID=UPI003652E383
MSWLFGAGARTFCAVTVLGAALLGPIGSAAARPVQSVNPPVIDLGALGEAQAISGNPAPLQETEMHALCQEPTLKGDVRNAPFAQKVLDLSAAWQFSRGEGQKVAVIDTGVNRHPRLSALQSGGDYVSNTDGTEDCDGHGTMVAGIIAAQQSNDDAFHGVAPAAEILSIRQLSLAYRAKDNRSGAQEGAIDSSGYGNLLTLAGAVVRAVDMGATVINISEIACVAAGTETSDRQLGAAVRYAYDHNVVVVVAAGNVGGGCEDQNDGVGWAKVKTVATPAWFSPYVLSVASVDPNGDPSEHSLNGPWVSVAAIGRDIVSLDSKTGKSGLVDAVMGKNGWQPIEGTSFAAPYVAGLAALVRSRFPALTAQEVMDRITRTAHSPGQGRDDRVGAGLIDPLAALTAQLPEQPISEGADQSRAFPEPHSSKGPDSLPRAVATVGSITCLAALVIGLAISIPFRRANRNDELPDFDS